MKKGIVFLLTMVSIFSSCKKEDKIAPVISSLNIEANDTLKNLFTVKAGATDNESIGRVEYYLNDSLITTLNAPPYDYQLNTLKLKDGSYTMSIVAYDAEGNKTESSRSIIVHNLLLSLKVGALNPSPWYIVVSDENGNILNTTTFTSNDTKKILPLTPCEVKTINIVYSNTYEQNTNMVAYINVKRGSELKVGVTTQNFTTKEVKLHLNNDLADFKNLDIVTNVFRYSLTSLADTVNLPAIPYTTDHKLLLQLQTSTGRYYKFFQLNDAKSLTLNLSSINTPESLITQTFPLTGNVFYLITSKAKPEDNDEYLITMGSKDYNKTKVDLFYPAEYFTRYHTLISYSLLDGSNKSYTNFWSGAVPETFSNMVADAQVTSSNPGGFKAVFSGTFDHYFAIYRIPSQHLMMTLNAPSKKNEWKLPDLSVAFGNNAFSLNNFLLYQLQLIDYSSLDLANKYYDLDTDQLVAEESYTQNLSILLRTE